MVTRCRADTLLPCLIQTSTSPSSGRPAPPSSFCHGLFGQGRNWNQIGKQLARDHRVLLVDMPNHGRSEWVDTIDYLDLADRVAGLFSADDPVTLVGHSMGGKIAMVLALRRPELVERLCVVDVSPVTYDNTREFAGYIGAMRGLDLAALERRSDADDRLRDDVPNDTVRSFLLQNLRREGDSWRWQVNLEVLGDQLAELGGWPEERLSDVSPVRRSGALGGRRPLRLRARGVRRGDGPLVPAQPAGDDQGRRPLGALRGARDLPGRPEPVPRRADAERGQPRCRAR